jgi:hypothetical protein
MSLGDFFHGTPGSVERCAHEIRSALCPIEFFGLPLSAEDEEKRARKIHEIIQASYDYDSEYFRRYADGLKKLNKRSEALDPDELDPQVLFVKAYFSLREIPGKLPTLQEISDLTNRIRAIVKITKHVPKLPLPNYSPASEQKIQQKIRSLSKQNWSRFCTQYKLKVAKGKRGPKPKSPAKQRPKKKK